MKPGLYPFLVLIFAFAAHAGPVYLDDSFAPSVRPTLQTLADDVWDIIGQMFHNAPPLNLSISCRYEKSDAPLTTVRPDEISIRLTAADSYYAQFAFQLSHELGHVMLDPRRSNGIIETICTAVSYAVLDRLGDRVTVSPRLSRLTDYAPHFLEYRIADQKSHLANADPEVRAMIDQQRWSDLSRYLSDHKSELEPGATRERDMQTVAAVALRSGPIDWGQFTGFAGCTSPSPAERPRFRISQNDPDCIERFANTLCRIGRGCGF